MKSTHLKDIFYGPALALLITGTPAQADLSIIKPSIPIEITIDPPGGPVKFGGTRKLTSLSSMIRSQRRDIHEHAFNKIIKELCEKNPEGSFKRNPEKSQDTIHIQLNCDLETSLQMSGVSNLYNESIDFCNGNPDGVFTLKQNNTTAAIHCFDPD